MYSAKIGMNSLQQGGHTKVFLYDDICFVESVRVPSGRYNLHIPLTAAMTNLICVVSVAQVKCV